MNSSNFLRRNVLKYPDVYAVKSEYGDLTYSELDEQVNKLSNALLTRGIKQIDKVILFMPNTLEFLISYFAIQRIGAIVVPININLSRSEIDYILNDSKPRAIIAHNLVFETLRGLDADIVKIKTEKGNLYWESFLEITDAASSDEVACLLTGDNLSTLLYTVDTNNEPKRVLFDYRSIITVSQMICAVMEVKSQSRILLMMSFNHSAPFHLFLMAGMVAGSTLILRTTFTPELLIEAVESEQTTHFFGTPEAYLLTAEKLQNKEANLSSVRWWIYDALPISSNEIEFIKRRFKTDQFVSINRITEDDYDYD